MRLTISNLAWEPQAEAGVLETLRGRGIGAIEIAPTKIWPDWQGLSRESAEAYLKSLGDIRVSSFQSLLFGRPELSIFGESRERTLEHLKQVAELASWLKAGPLVFGSPKNRDPGERSADAAFGEAREFFYEIGEYCAGLGVTLCLEANPKEYGARFITSAGEAALLVRAVGSCGFRLHLDSACMYLAGDDAEREIEANIDIVSHYHASEPNLSTFRDPVTHHIKIAAALERHGYKGYVSIEMLNKENRPEAVAEAVDYVKGIYGN